jgi:XTP/dITP diphosphohydrolase
MALVLNNENHLFEGTIKGTITNEKRGTNGFGYDPVFMPDGYNKTFAEMSFEEKSSISHRAIALHKLTAFLRTL